MGMFDWVKIYMCCPKCGHHGHFELQTKDLECQLYSYSPLSDQWFTDSKIYGKAINENFQVPHRVPYDKEPTVWANQAERIETYATPKREISCKLKYIEAYGDCPNCKTWVGGKIKIQDGLLIEPLYDIEIEEK